LGVPKIAKPLLPFTAISPCEGEKFKGILKNEYSAQP